MSDDTLDTLDGSSVASRTDAISALGILGFINTGFFTLLYALGTMGMFGIKNLSDQEWQEVVSTGMDQYKGMMKPDDLEMYEAIIPVLKESGWLLCLLLLAVTLVRLFSIIKMWKLKKSGLTVYAVSQAARIAVPCFFFGMAGFSVMGALLAGGMVAAWFSQRKHMA